MLRRLSFALIPAALFVAAHPALGLELDPYPVRNLAPPQQVHILNIAEPLQQNRPGQISARLGFDLANDATVSHQNGEAIILDGETYVATLGLRYGLADNLQVGLDLPWVSHESGFLDNFVQLWHNFFGLPNGNRDELPNNQLDFSYSRNGDELLHLDERASGFGDTRLLVGWQWLSDDRGSVNLQGTVKAPTGDSGKLLGSGGWDVSLGISGQHNFESGWGKVAVWSGVGGSWLGSGEVLPDLARQWAANGWLGAGWCPADWIDFKVQVDAQTALYRSELSELGAPAVILTLGGNLAAGENTSVEIDVGEDLNVRTAPDFTMTLAVSHGF